MIRIPRVALPASAEPVRASAHEPVPRAPALPPLPRTWTRPIDGEAPAGAPHRLSQLFRDHSRAVGAVLAGASALTGLGAPAVYAADTTPIAPPITPSAVSTELAREALFGAPSLAPGVHDAASTTAAQLQSLARSSSGADRRLAATITNARTAYHDLIQGGARVLVTNLAANGGQPVLVLVPAGFDGAKPAKVHTHYHGWNSTVAEAIGHSAGAGARIRGLIASDPQTVFVLPECGNAPAQRGKYATDWSNVRSQSATTDAALAAVGVTHVGARVVSAHSGGGSALARAIERTPDGSGLRADRLELLDSLYGSESAIAGWASTASGQATKRIVYVRGTNVLGRDAGIGAAFGARYDGLDLAAKGVADPHNRAAGLMGGD